jgi:hypothetical protein
VNIGVRELYAQVRADHTVTHGGWNKAVKTSTGSWEDGEDLGGACRSCGGTKVYRSGLEKSGDENHRSIENGTTCDVPHCLGMEMCLYVYFHLQ